MAADSKASDGTTQCTVRKVFRLKDRSLVGFCGSVPEWASLVQWLDSGREGRQPPLTNSSALRIDGKNVECFEGRGSYLITQPRSAIGTGAQAALAVMTLGHTPKEAVQAARDVDPNTGGRIVVLEV